MFDRRQRRFDHIFHIQGSPNLMQDGSHIPDASIRQHDEFELSRSFEIVQFVLSCAIGEELVVLPAELTHHASEREDCAEN